MNVTEYLQRYDRDYDRLIKWVISSGGNAATAKKQIRDLADKNHGFSSGAEFDKALLQGTYDAEVETSIIFHKMRFWKKVKWLLTRKP